jgi:Tol biopolymer transport system component/DNA-binding winged helix-turn-helix (wHTH) protein
MAMGDEIGGRGRPHNIRDSPFAAREAVNRDTPELYEFGPFRLEPAERKLFRGSEVVVLTPKAFDMLVLLVRNSGHLLEKEELMRVLWPDSFVEEGNLSNNIFLLRKALGEDPPYIETVPKRGYRFIAQVQTSNGLPSPDARSAIHVVEPHESEPSAVDRETPKPRWKSKAAIAGTGVALALGAAVLTYLWTRPEPVPKVSNYVQLTHDGQPKRLVGSDGSRLYMGLGQDESSGIAQMSVSGGDPTRIPSPYQKGYPANLSPDGSKLLVIDWQGNRDGGPLWSLPVLGGVPSRLGDTEGTDAAWSPDGEMLAYTKELSPAHDSALFVAKADGTEPRELVAVKRPSYLTSLVWSPDGTKLRFDARDSLADPSSFLWEVSVDGKGLHRLLPGWIKPPDWECCGKWTADGRYFIFRSRHQIWALPRKGGFLHSQPKPIQLISSPLWFASPVPSKDGKKLFVVGRTYRGELMRYDSKSGQFSPFLGGISVEYVAFSKDGQWAAYVSFPEGTLWRSKADGSERLQLTYPPGYAVNPRWSPDGNRIVFHETFADKPPRIFEVSPQGGSLRQLMPDDPSPQGDPNWSPDGSKIVLGGADATSTIRVLDLTTHQVATLPGSQDLFSPRWSPNGRYLAAVSFGPKPVVFLFDFQTQKWTEIARGALGWQAFSKDGQYLYLLDNNGMGAVLRIRVSDHKTETVVILKNFAQTGNYGSALSLAPDDSPLLLRDMGTQDVYALDWEEP